MNKKLSYSLPIRTWEALDQARHDDSRRISNLEGKIDIILWTVGFLAASNAAIIALAVAMLMRG